MNLYDAIAENYSDIFPLGQERVDFVLSLVPKGAAILDVGCADGSLALELAASGREVTGVDLNDRMIELATARRARRGLSARFLVQDMLEISEKSLRRPFDLLVCLGNTLPHLGSLEQIRTLFTRFYGLLGEGGQLLFQLLNYENILAERPPTLPLIETERIKFVRRYEYLSQGRINFTSTLLRKQRGEELSGSTILFPARRQDLTKILGQVGFSLKGVYKNFAGEAAGPKDWSLLFLAERN